MQVIGAVAASPAQELVIGAVMFVVGAGLTVRFPSRAAGLSRAYMVVVRAGWLLVALLGLVSVLIGVARLV